MMRPHSALRVRTSSSSTVTGSYVSSGPPSPSFTATTNASQMDLSTGPDTIITRRDLRQSINAFEDVCDLFLNPHASSQPLMYS